MRATQLRRFSFFLVAATAVWMACPSRVLAVDGSVEDKLNPKSGAGKAAVAAANTGGGTTFWSVLQLILALAIIIAIIYLLIRFLSTRTNLSRGQAIQSLGAHSLAGNRSVHLLTLGDKLYLVGVGENVTLLDTIDDQELLERLKNETQTTFVPKSNITSLQELIGKLRSKPKAQAENIELSDLPFDATLREKLNSLKEQRHQAVEDWQEGQER